MDNAMQIKFIRKIFMKNETVKDRGFTLVELLVVISIIALLLAVLMPAMGKARKLAQRTVCQTRLQQLTMAGMVYSQGNNGKFPHQYADNVTNNHYKIEYPITTTNADAQDSWIKHIYPYIKKLEHFRCPGDTVLDSTYPPKGIEDFSYTSNGVIAHFGGANTKRTSETVVYYDDPDRSRLSILRPFYTGDVSMIKTGRYWSGWMCWINGDLQAQPHSGGKCFGFMDGHVKYAKWQDVTSLWFQLLITRQYIDGQEPVKGRGGDMGSGSYADLKRTAAIKW
jgi:prepilin-type N-terminal cleavage/methylation domain-containing protein